MGRNLVGVMPRAWPAWLSREGLWRRPEGVPRSGGAQADAECARRGEGPGGKAQGPAGQDRRQFRPMVVGLQSTKEEKPSCSLVQALVERDSNKLVFRVTVAYGPQGNLVLRIDGPTGVALQKGLEFSPDEVKTYRMPFQTCLPRGCSAVLVVADDLKQDLQKSQKGTITVYALGGQAVRAPAQFAGFADGLAALDKRRGKP